MVTTQQYDDAWLSDIYDMWYPSWYHNPWLWGLLGMLIVGSALILWLCWRAYTLSDRPFLTREQEVRQRLASLSVESVHSSESCKNFYGELTCIIKCCLAYGCDYQLAHLTDSELLDYVKTTTLPQEVISDIERIVLVATEAKFAQWIALKKQLEEDRADIEKLLDICSKNGIGQNAT